MDAAAGQLMSRLKHPCDAYQDVNSRHKHQSVVNSSSQLQPAWKPADGDGTTAGQAHQQAETKFRGLPALQVLSAVDVCNVLWSFGVLNHPHAELLPVLLTAAGQGVGQLQSRTLALLAWAVVLVACGMHKQRSIAGSSVGSKQCHTHAAEIACDTLKHEADASDGAAFGGSLADIQDGAEHNSSATSHGAGDEQLACQVYAAAISKAALLGPDAFTDQELTQIFHAALIISSSSCNKQITLSRECWKCDVANFTVLRDALARLPAPQSAASTVVTQCRDSVQQPSISHQQGALDSSALDQGLRSLLAAGHTAWSTLNRKKAVSALQTDVFQVICCRY